ncbi:MAG TPA: MBL fold metallo-hydrolase [Candidatus Binataceae bacterium]|nr:MBL fold metallo-hydrolase [Candidatus Binataceae bacterium]
MIATELNHAKCKSYLLVSESDGKAVMIDPVRERIDRYLAVLAYHRRHLELIIDTHTHADHRTGAFELGELTGAPVAMHRRAPAPHVAVHLQDGQWLAVGDLRIQVLHTPGHTPDSISLYAGDRVFTGDVLLIHGTGRADFADGDPGAQYDAITQKLFALPDQTMVFPAHDYRGHTQSTIGDEKRGNPRIANRSRDQYIEIMNHLGLPLPDSIQEALQPNQSALDADSMHFPTYAQLNQVRQVAAAEVAARLGTPNLPLLIDVREPDEFRGDLGHIAGSHLIPLRELPERTAELADYKNRDIVVICRAGARSTTAAALLTGMGFERVGNLKGGMLDWNEAQFPVER